MARQPVRRSTQGKQVQVKISAPVEKSGSNEDIDLSAYLFSRNGQLLDSKAFGNKESVSLKTTIKRRTQVRVVVGPTSEHKKSILPDLIRRGSREKLTTIDPAIPNLSLVMPIDLEKFLCWLRSRCLVKGTLLKKIERDGIDLDAPVCNAVVDIYEVDPIHIIIPRLPDWVLDRFRDIIINPPVPLPDPPPIAIPLPRPRPGSRVIPRLQPNNISRLTLNRNIGLIRTPGTADITANLNTDTRKALFASIPDNLKQVAGLQNNLALKKSLVDHPIIAKNLLCLIYPRIVTMQKVATATTDSCGKFSVVFHKGCNNKDTPDLYFIARQRIFPFGFTTIYEPKPVPCHTHWNYQCGTEVTLYTTHPLARTCNPCRPVDAEPKYVLAMTIGNTSVNDIFGASADLEDQTNANNRGLLIPTIPEHGTGRPFGGTCRLQLDFDADDLADIGVEYYRVSWRKGDSGSFTPLDGAVNRHYIHEVPNPDDPSGPDVPVLSAYLLGPIEVNDTADLFRIPPVSPPKGKWSTPQPVNDTTSAVFNTAQQTVGETTLEQAGKYQLKVELFDSNGNKVTNTASKGISFYVMSGTDSSGTILTTNADDLGLVDDDAMFLTLHVDNNPCTAMIDGPRIDSRVAGDDCGLLTYNQARATNASNADDEILDMDFTATHPNGFGWYRFTLKRGINTVLSESDEVPGGSVSVNVDNTLLGSCAVSGVAAFAEHLYVHATATNGWSELDAYDDSEIRAFVLAPGSSGNN